MREKLYFNGIPVYRLKLENGDIEYRLFEYNGEDDYSGHIVVVKKQDRIDNEVKVVLDYIASECDRGSIGYSIRFGVWNGK